MQHSAVNTATFLQGLQALAAQVQDRDAGFFGPDSICWRINREPILHIAGPRALLMQLAHPMVARGVVEHSDYEEDLYGRTIRTFSAVYAMIFGTVDEALSWARRVHATHNRVRGEGYRANDPDLLMWVNATLLDSAVYAYHTYVQPLSHAEREQHYEEMRIFAGLFGIGDDVLPADWGGFEHYVAESIDSDTIHVSPQGREIASALLRGKHFLRIFGPGARVAAAGMLAPKLRRGFGLRWDRRTALAYEALTRTTRLVYRRVPSALRTMPMAHEAEWRLKDREPTTWWSRPARGAQQILRAPIRRGFRSLGAKA